MADISESVCLNHPDTPAVCRCATCGKPVCNQCVVSRNGSGYCSEKCASDAADSVNRVSGALADKAKSDARRKKRAIVVLIVFIAAAGAAYFLYQRNRNDVDRFLRKTGNEISRKAGETEQSIRQSIPSSSSYKRSRENLVQ